MGAKAIIFICFAYLTCCTVVVASRGPGLSRSLLEDNATQIFDVTTFGAVADGQTDNVEPFMQAWINACKNSTGPSKVLIPSGTYLAGPTVFQGPCNSSNPVMVEILGTILAVTDPSEYESPEWFSFEHIDGLVISGNGTFDGQGASLWQYNDCKKNPDCSPLPSSFQFSNVNNSFVSGITSLNAMQFHFHLNGCNNFTATGLNITAPRNSPNTDGMHFGYCSSVNVTSSVIATGDDCISIGEGTTNISISNVTCGPGHGISVGSLGKRPEDRSVSGVKVTNCTFIGTTNGARIKTFIGTNAGEAKDIVYENIVMVNVSNPVVIDQSYGRKSRVASNSLWKISDVHFKNITGTTSSNAGVTIRCSTLNPCEAVEVADVNLSFAGPQSNQTFFSLCNNAQTTFQGTSNPPACT